MEQRKKIMIIDDNLIDQMITAHVLKSNNTTNEDLLIMENAYLALDYLEANKNNLNAMPSLILLDLDMPGMSGYEFLQHYKNFSQEIKSLCRIIVLTGSDIQADIDRVEADPYVSKLITKPLSKNQLIPML